MEVISCKSLLSQLHARTHNKHVPQLSIENFTAADPISVFFLRASKQLCV